MSTTTGADGANAQGSDTPPGENVSDVTTPTGTGTPVTSGNDDSVSTTAATRSDDTRGQGYDLTKLFDRLDALPESIANAVKEAAPVAPVSVPTSDTTANNADQSGTTTSATGDSGDTTAIARSRSERFAGWWFGK